MLYSKKYRYLYYVLSAPFFEMYSLCLTLIITNILEVEYLHHLFYNVNSKETSVLNLEQFKYIFLLLLSKSIDLV